MKINELLEDKIVSITDKYLVFTCRSDRDMVEYPNYAVEGNTIFLPVRGKQYKEIGENLYQALTDKKVDLFDLDNNTRKVLYDTITTHPLYNICKDERSWDNK